MNKTLFALLLSVVVSGCATTKNVEKMANINIENDKSVPVRFLVNATAIKDTVFIFIKGEQKFKFVFSMSTAIKTLEDEIDYNGQLLKARCKLDISSEKATLSYVAHDCSIYVNGKLALQREF